MTDPTNVDTLVQLSQSRGLRNELDQISARATLATLEADVERNWRYRTERGRSQHHRDSDRTLRSGHR